MTRYMRIISRYNEILAVFARLKFQTEGVDEKIIFFALLLTGAAWAVKFNEPDADKNGELDVLELRGYEPEDYIKALCANWNEKVGRNARRVSEILTQENQK